MTDRPHPDPRSMPKPTSLPQQIGEYAIQRVLGAGGMATVYAALQKQPRRTVALKVMRSAANAETALRRFRREIEILGRLRHPYIAQVYDAGVHDDGSGPLPYFVMEYVPRAKTIIEFAEAKELSLRHRLKLFTKVCAAVDSGHQSRIIHRDLKPGNILIDEAGDPRVIDFGVARAVDLDLAAQTIHTEEGRLVGTVQYMAPEQLEATPGDLDARCDVYALGVVLYKLLTGRAPHDLTGLPLFTAAQVIREDMPPRPSTFKPELRGDLETIILKALAKDRLRRYATAGELGRDLLRFLTSKPIKAKRTSAARRARLFARRHRVELSAAAIVFLVIVIAGAVIVYQRAALSPSTPSQPPVGADAPTGVDTAPPAAAPPAPPPAADRAIPLAGLAQPVTDLAFDPSGTLLAGGSEDGNIVIWDVQQQQPLLTTNDHQAPIRHLAFTADGTLLASAADDGRIVIIRRDGGQIENVIRHEYGRVHAMALSADGQLIAIGGEDLTLHVHGRGGTLLSTIRGTRGAFHALAFSPDAAAIATGSERGDVRLWDPQTGQALRRLEGLRQDRVIALSFDPAGQRLTAVTSAGAGRTWAIGPGEPDRSFAAGGAGMIATAFDPTGRWLICTTGERLTVVDLETGQQLSAVIPLANGRSIGAIAVGPDGRWLVIGDRAGRVELRSAPQR